jgi:hypothetical protein
MSDTLDVRAHLAKTPEARAKAREAARVAADAALWAYCGLLAAEAAEIVRAVLPTAMRIEFHLSDQIGPSVSIYRIRDADGVTLYDGDFFTTAAVAAPHRKGDEWLDESELRDKLTSIVDYCHWYLADEFESDPDFIIMNLARLGFTPPPANLTPAQEATA